MEKRPLVLPLIFLLLSFTNAKADEGMWLPMLLNETVYHDMQNEGLRLSPEDIYNTNESSMKDGVLLFGGGCTGEVISNNGLLITNYHCGRGAVQSHSSIEKDYLKNGFWAMNPSEELKCDGLSVTFIVRMDDVTTLVLNGVNNELSEAQRQSLIESNSRQIVRQIMEGTAFNAVVRPFYYGNQYILIVSQTFKDIRLVGAPPESIGDFGGDADNWEWPRHNADFSLFRIYADSHNNPADYASENVPYQPHYFFTISLKGVKENDFAMVYGFPGRTTEYLPSYAVALTQNITDPDRVSIREARLKIWWDAIQKNDTTRLHYASKYYGLSNGWKKWQGEILGLNSAGVMAKKKSYEDTFLHRIANNTDWQNEYGNLLPELKKGYDSLEYWQPLLDYYSEALKAPEIFSVALQLRTLYDVAQSDTIKPSTLTELTLRLRKQLDGFFKNYDKDADKKVTAAMFGLFMKSQGVHSFPASVRAAYSDQQLNGVLFTETMFRKSFLDDQKEVDEFLDHFKKGNEKKLLKDPVFVYGNDIDHYYSQLIVPAYQKWNDKVNALQRIYMEAQMKVFPEKKFYPDANLSLRLAYGKVTGYDPRDGVSYDYYTTGTGILQKYQPDDEYYDTPAKFVDLLKRRDFARYASSDGQLHACFITTCHTTGGNSGSPVIDANGNLIGTNFDRCWEGTMSDIYYDSSLCRNIAVDIRYILFVIDKYGGAGYLLNEMRFSQ